MLYRARTLLPCHHALPGVVDDGALVVHGDRIAAVGPWAEVRAAFGAEPVTDLGEVILLPGLINAHCHLDYSMMRGALSTQGDFAAWIGRINALKRSLDPEDFLLAIERGFRELRRWGTTTVLNIAAFPELIPRLGPPPLRTWWFYEMIDLRSSIATEELVAGALSFFQEHPGWPGGFGLSPHAPYTASPELYRLAGRCAQRLGMPLTTHLSESVAERRMFADAAGPLHDFLASLGRPMADCGHGRSGLAQLTAAGALGSQCIGVHLNELDAADLTLFAPGGALSGMSIVHCPGTHRYFGRAPFRWRELAERGVNLCVGTDSLASNGALNLFGELRLLAQAEPSLTPRDLLRTVTRAPARALGLAEVLGTLRPGAYADLIAIPAAGGLEKEAACAAVLDCSSPVDFLLVGGQSVPRG